MKATEKREAEALAQAQHQLSVVQLKHGSRAGWLIRELTVERGCMGGMDELDLTIRLSATNNQAATALVNRLAQMMKEQG